MTEAKERDEALIAEIAEVFPPDTVDVQSRYVIVHQLRASADIQDAQTKRETGWADTSDRACLMRKAADALDALLAKLQPAPKPDRAKVLARDVLLAWSGYQQLTDEEAGSEEFAKACRFTQTALDELRAEWEAERPAVVVPEDILEWAKSTLACRPFYIAMPMTNACHFLLSLDGAKGGE